MLHGLQLNEVDGYENSQEKQESGNSGYKRWKFLQWRDKMRKIERSGFWCKTRFYGEIREDKKRKYQKGRHSYRPAETNLSHQADDYDGEYDTFETGAGSHDFESHPPLLEEPSSHRTHCFSGLQNLQNIWGDYISCVEDVVGFKWAVHALSWIDW